MTWDYLYEERLDWRFKYAADKLKDHIAGAVIVDVDCMHAPLIKYIPDTWERYIGNDIQEVFPDNKRAEFMVLNDALLPYKLYEISKRVDILCCFGVGGFEVSHEPAESEYLTQTLITIAKEYTPKFFVLEAVTKYAPILQRIMVETGYYPAFQYRKITKNDWVEDRRIYVCKKRFGA